jgi:hypothetical protein
VTPGKSIYQNRICRQVIHSRPVSRMASALLGPQRCGEWIGQMLRPYLMPDKINVLAVGRELFFKDTAQIEKRTGIHFIPWLSGHLGRLQQGWVPKVCQRQGHFFPAPVYRTHPGWDKGRAMMRAIHQTLEKTADVPVIISANVDYWQEEALRQYCTETGTPHLVLCRENISMPYYRQRVIDRHRKYGFRFHGHVAVFSSNMKDVLIESGACSAEQITVTGAPRLDIWLDERPAIEKDTVTLLSFRTNLFADIFSPVFTQFIKIARMHPEYRFVVKCKEGRDDSWSRKVQKQADLPPNLELLHHVDLRGLLERSLTIIGVNSLAVVEALLTNAAIIVPCWGEAGNDPGRILIDPHDETLQQEMSFCANPKDLEELIENSILSPRQPDRACRELLINRYMHHTPGQTASQRVGDLITRLVENLNRKA